MIWNYGQEFENMIKRTADEGFTQVFTMKQKQTMKKHVSGKSSYKTRARDDPPPSAQ